MSHFNTILNPFDTGSGLVSDPLPMGIAFHLQIQIRPVSDKGKRLSAKTSSRLKDRLLEIILNHACTFGVRQTLLYRWPCGGVATLSI